MRVGVVGRIVVAVVGVGAAACAPLTGLSARPSPVITVVDIDGPSVHVMIDGVLVADVTCGFATRVAMHAPTAPGGVVHLRVTDDDGVVLDERDVPIGDGNLRLVVRRDVILVAEEPPPYALEPSADCPEAADPS